MSSAWQLGPTHVTGPPRFLVRLSARALPNHPGGADGCSWSFLPHRFQASPPLAGWPPSSQCHGAESGSLSLGLVRSRSRATHPFATTRAVTGPLPTSSYPSAGGRRYMANDQFPWLTPLSQQDAPGFAWRTKDTKRSTGSARACESPVRLLPSCLRVFVVAGDCRLPRARPFPAPCPTCHVTASDPPRPPAPRARPRPPRQPG
jgi:hypothetical protein